MTNTDFSIIIKTTFAVSKDKSGYWADFAKGPGHELQAVGPFGNRQAAKEYGINRNWVYVGGS